MKIVIIGAQAAGMSAAAKAKRMMKEAEIHVYDATDIVSFGACGLPYFVGGFFQEKEKMIARTAEQFQKSGIVIHQHQLVETVDVKQKQLTVKDLLTEKKDIVDYDRLLIATGASAVRPSWLCADYQNVHMLKTMSDGVKLKEQVTDPDKKNIVIVGAGYIGLETVEAMKNLGKNVTLLQRSEHVLSKTFDVEIAEKLEEELRQHIDYRTGETIVSLVGDEVVSEVVTNKGRYAADVVIVAAGIRPNTEFLQNTGIKMLENGAVVINEYGETSIPDIYAAGDCATVYHLLSQTHKYIPLATTANKIGRIVGENLTGAKTSFEGTLGSACLKVMNLEAARTGLTEKEAKELGILYQTTFISDKNQTHYYPGQVDLWLKLIYHADTKKLLGAQMVGKKQVVHRVDALAVAIYAGLTTEQLGMLDFCYAPPFARAWDILNVAGNASK